MSQSSHHHVVDDLHSGAAVNYQLEDIPQANAAQQMQMESLGQTTSGDSVHSSIHSHLLSSVKHDIGVVGAPEDDCLLKKDDFEKDATSHDDMKEVADQVHPSMPIL